MPVTYQYKSEIQTNSFGTKEEVSVEFTVSQESDGGVDVLSGTSAVIIHRYVVSSDSEFSPFSNSGANVILMKFEYSSDCLAYMPEAEENSLDSINGLIMQPSGSSQLRLQRWHDPNSNAQQDSAVYDETVSGSLYQHQTIYIQRIVDTASSSPSSSTKDNDATNMFELFLTSPDQCFVSYTPENPEGQSNLHHCRFVSSSSN
jgi:hypothetical protein